MSIARVCGYVFVCFTLLCMDVFINGFVLFLCFGYVPLIHMLVFSGCSFFFSNVVKRSINSLLLLLFQLLYTLFH